MKGDFATVEMDGKRRVLHRGMHYRAAASDRQSVTLAADPRGHVFTEVQ